MMPKLIAPILLVAGLSGCALNALRVEDAAKVATATTSATAGARTFLDHVDRAREATNIALGVADPACAQVAPQLRDPPDIGPRAPAIGALCIDPPTGTVRRLSLLPIAGEIEPTLKLIAAMAAYGDALVDIVEVRHNQSASQPLIDALELARAAQNALTSIAGQPAGPLPPTDDPRVAAAANLVDFLGKLALEAQQVGDLRAFVATHPDGIAPTIEVLKRQIGTWERARSGDAGLRLFVSDAASARVLQTRPLLRAVLRRKALTDFYATRDDNRREALLAPALLLGIDAVAAADADLRRVLTEHPHLTARERAAVGALNRQRIVAGLNHVAALAASLRGD